jgi:hypothetical protein
LQFRSSVGFVFILACREHLLQHWVGLTVRGETLTMFIVCIIRMRREEIKQVSPPIKSQLKIEEKL